MYAICQRTKEKLDQVGDQWKIEKRYASFEDLLKTRTSTQSTSIRPFTSTRSKASPR
jgi:hypothetical protein